MVLPRLWEGVHVIEEEEDEEDEIILPTRADADADFYDKWRDDWAETLDQDFNEFVKSFSEIKDSYYHEKEEKILRHLKSTIEYKLENLKK